LGRQNAAGTELTIPGGNVEEGSSYYPIMIENLDSSRWFLDSGAYSHICNDRAAFITFEEQWGTVDGTGELKTFGVGTAVLNTITTTGKEFEIRLSNCLFAPLIKFNLISLGRITEVEPPDITIRSDDIVWNITSEDTIILPKVGYLYLIPTTGEQTALVNRNMTAVVTAGAKFLQNKLTHIGPDVLKRVERVHLLGREVPNLWTQFPR
jgi:hypothetical protein